MRKTVIVIGMLLIAASAGAGQEQGGAKSVVMRARVPLEAKSVKGAPYSAETVNDHVQLLADGNRIVEHSTGRVYRDKDGRVRREEDRPSGGVLVSIVDPVAGVSYSLDPQNRVAWKTPTPSLLANVAEAKAQIDMKVRRMREAGQPAEALSFEVSDGRVEIRRRAGESEQRSDEQLTARTIEGVQRAGSPNDDHNRRRHDRERPADCRHVRGMDVAGSAGARAHRAKGSAHGRFDVSPGQHQPGRP